MLTFSSTTAGSVAIYMLSTKCGSGSKYMDSSGQVRIIALCIYPMDCSSKVSRICIQRNPWITRRQSKSMDFTHFLVLMFHIGHILKMKLAFKRHITAIFSINSNSRCDRVDYCKRLTQSESCVLLTKCPTCT